MKSNKTIWLLVLVLGLAAHGCAKKAPSGSAAGGDEGGMGAGAGGMGSGDSGSMSGAGGAGGSASTISADGKFAPVFFEFDQAALTEQARQTLKSHYMALNKDAKLNVVIEGHADERGTTEYNIALGERRARAIRDYLVNLGLQNRRLSIISYGEERPAIDGHDEDAWSRNRRGEFLIAK